MRGRLGTGLLVALALVALPAGAALAAAAGPDAPVADAAQEGDLEAVRALLREGADPNAAQGDGMTALHWAAMRGHAEMAEALLYAGAHTESTTRIGGYTPLHLAARYGRGALVTTLLEGGADPRATTTTGVTPIHLAAGAGLAGAIADLAAAGADVDAVEGAHAQTPLMFASAANRLEAVRALVEAGADVSAVSTVIDYAERAEEDREARRRRQEVVAAIRKAEAEARGETEAAEAEEQAEGTRTQAPPGQEPTPQEEEPPEEPEEEAEGEDPPQGEDPPAPGEGEAVAEPDPELGADPRRVAGRAEEETPAGEPVEEETPGEEKAADEKPDEETPAEEASEDEAHADDPAGGEKAAGEKAEASEPAPRPLSYAELVGRQGGMSALHYAARDGHADVVAALLAAGADIDRPTGGDRSTPLLLAAINGHYDLARWLLERGADPNLASEDGVAPLYAVIANRWAPKALYPQPTAFKQQETSYLALMDALLAAGADPNARVETHIWYASFNFDLLGVNFMGATPFWRAAYALDVPAMELLVANGADPHVPTRKPPERRRRRPGDDEEEEEEDPSGLPPVEVGGPGIPPIVAAAGVGYGRARAGNSHRHAPDSWLAAAKYLVEVVGADPNARDHDGFSALHYAAARGDNELIEYLVSKGADPTVVARTGQTTVDMANGPIQRVQPFPETIALLEGMGAVNNHDCVSC
ncbi:MAG: ankyrin repeat domain-containing protein [Gemmatimonadota bacterium]|nr:ankyrin repeat domain-containing protein [Gemmatimonadota bacterium]